MEIAFRGADGPQKRLYYFSVNLHNDYLKKSAFKVWQLGHLLGDLTFFVVDLGTIPELVGLYHLVVKLWSPAVDGTFAFYIHAQKGKKADQSGWTLASVVKVKS